jgi:DNA-binding SARP family transcriptional activator
VEPWPNRRSKSLFKYLVSHRERPVPKEVLMDLLWPGARARAARNNLNVAVYNLRRTMRNGDDRFSYVLFRDDAYRLNPDLDIWVDAEEFERLVASARRMARAGDTAGAIGDYEVARALYAGDLFDDDPHEEWTFERRRALQEEYLRALAGLGAAHLGGGEHEAAAEAFRAALAVDPCREEAHRGLMRCYALAGQRHLALRQYRRCAEALRTSLGLAPDPDTAALDRAIRQGGEDPAPSGNSAPANRPLIAPS